MCNTVIYVLRCRVLKLEDKLRAHPFYFNCATLAIEVHTVSVCGHLIIYLCSNGMTFEWESNYLYNCMYLHL